MGHEHLHGNEHESGNPDVFSLTGLDGSGILNVGAAAANALTIEAKVNEVGGISKGQSVYVSGASGQIPQVSLCDNTDSAKHKWIGLAAETKVDGQTILVRGSGELASVDTDGTGTPGTSETWADGDVLYMITGGNLSNVQPTSGEIHTVAVVSYAHGVNGKLLILIHEEAAMAAASGEDIIIRMGDVGGVNKTIFKDYANVEVGALDSNGNFTLDGTVDGREVGTDGSKLDGIEALADVTSSNEAGSVEGTNVLSSGEAGGDKFLREDGDDSSSWQTVPTPSIEGTGVLSTSETAKKVLVAQGDDSSDWENVEGTDVISTGESGGTKFLREDGDGSCSWQAADGNGACRQVVYFETVKGVNLSVNSGTRRYMIPFAGTPTSITIKSAWAMVGTAPIGATIIVDINKNGTTIFTTQGNRPFISIAANDSGEVTAIDVTSVSKGDYFTFDVDNVGTTITGKDLVIALEIEIIP